MLFNSLHFLVFFPIVVGLYFTLPQRGRILMLLLVSYYFYMCWKPAYIVLLLLSTAIDYVAGLQMGQATRPAVRRGWLAMSLVSNLGLLFSFKYFNFFNGALRDLFSAFDLPYAVPALDVLLPIGISFYTFQTLSYTIDVYRGCLKPERNLIRFALYVSFFPQLVAGPIERSMSLLPQFLAKHEFNYERAASGLQLMLWGFFKKLAIADRCALIVNQAYAQPQQANGAILLLGTVLFAFQIYCDFSGYSDIARGSARVMGYELMVNFKRPYFARSISEFWQRWHISLSTWFRDYLYIPLGGNRVVKWRWQANLFFVFLVSGLWHGANWTFLVWGALHGALMVGSLWTRRIRQNVSSTLGLLSRPLLHRMVQTAITFLLVLLAWVFFRAESLTDALLILRKLFVVSDYRWDLSVFDLTQLELELTAGLIGLLLILQALDGRKPMQARLARWPLPVRWAVLYASVLGVILLGRYQQMEFIYFQF